MLVNELSPKEVFFYFEELSKIPRGSGNTVAVGDYCLEFAKQHNLKARKDAAGNVVIFKEGSKGYEEKDAVILQGHLDMVCEKETGCEIDMSRESIRLCTDGEKLWADGTTLGADDGIAVAYVLAILASDTIAHPPIQAVLTNDEEIGMLGARDLDTEGLTAKRLINLDSESEGIIYVSCAGGVRANCRVPVSFEACNKETASVFDFAVSGLEGGHSGIEIHKGHTNAIKLLASILIEAAQCTEIRLIDLNGGGKDNVIPKEANAKLLVKAAEKEKFLACMEENIVLWMQAIQEAEPNAKLELKESSAEVNKALDPVSTENALFALQMSPDGVYKMSRDIEGMVQTSLNLGMASLETDSLVYGYLIRSNTAAYKELLIKRVETFVSHLSGSVETRSDYPAWEYKKDSELREICISSFLKVYGYEPEVTSIHAGLECGILSGKLPRVDMISFGPTLKGVHTPDECMDVASAKRTWEYLLEILKDM